MSTELMQTSGSIEPEVVCPSCGTPYQCIDKAHSKYFVCSNCKTYYKYNEEHNNYESITIIGENRAYAYPTFLIGNTAVFSGVTYTVVGVILKQDDTEGAVWIEYLLHSKEVDNYLTVSEWSGHYSLIKKYDLSNDTVYTTYDDKRYIYSKTTNKNYNELISYGFTIVGLWGEFDWDVLADSGHVKVEEYLLDDQLLIREITNDDTVQGFMGSCVSRSSVARAFNLRTRDLSNVTRTYIPDVGRRLLIAQKRAVVALVCLASMLIIFLLSMSGNNETVVQSLRTEVDSSGNSEANHISTKSFDITASGIVETKIYSSIYNTWISVVADLVNENTGEVIEGETDFEYYSGVEGGESWSEGSPGGSFKFSRVKRGKYHLEIVVQQERGKPIPSVVVDVVQGSSSGSNLIWMMLLVAALPTIQWIYLHDEYNKLMFGNSD